jgi:hypothetical protein
MPRRKALTPESSPRDPRANSSQSRRPVSLEDQLFSVVEREGITVLTPRGAKRGRAPSVRETVAFLSETTPAEPTIDHVANLDSESVARLVVNAPKEEPKVVIRREEHQRSPYVVSLRRVPLVEHAPAEEDRVSISHTLSHAPAYFGAMPVEAYAAVSSDLVAASDPRWFHAQFTPADFHSAYSAVYGPFDRLHSMIKNATLTFRSLFERVERVENQVADSIENVMTEVTEVQVTRFSFARALAGFAALALVVTLPANAIGVYRSVMDQRDATTASGADAVSAALSAKDATSIGAGADALKRASVRFRETDAALSQANALAIGLAALVPSKYRSARALLEAGDKSTEAARLLAVGLDKVFADPSRRLDERLDVMGAYSRASMLLLSDASKAAASVDRSAIPEAQRGQVDELVARLEDGTEAIREFAALSDTLAILAGKETLRKYLIIFQNQTELRPTGGFMGSFAEVTIDRGNVSEVRVPPGGTYELKGMLTERVASPKPLQLINAQWQFQDSNWSPDFPTAADKIRWFWSKSGQSTVDGVIAINASFVEKLLDITGPIEMPEYGKTIDSKNFLLETQKAVEIEYDREANTPKKFVGDLADRLRERLKHLTKEEWLAVAGLASESIETKDIQVALFDSEEAELAARFGWNGRLKDSPGDSLALIEANVAGQKTDAVVDEQVRHEVKILDDGSIEDRVVLTRTHNGTKGELFRGVRNVSYLRAYVPVGSRLISAEGFEAPPENLFKEVGEDLGVDSSVSIVESTMKKDASGADVSTERDRTVFGGWMQLDPGETQTITLSYRLPFTVHDVLTKLDAAPSSEGGGQRGAYVLLATSQSGKTNRTIETTVEYPAEWKVAWNRSTDPNIGFSGTWDRDRVVSALFSFAP